MKIPNNLPWDRTGLCEIDSSYHIGVPQNNHSTGMLIDNNRSIDKLILDVWDDKDNGNPEELADYILSACNNFPKAIELLKECTQREDYTMIEKINEFLKEVYEN